MIGLNHTGFGTSSPERFSSGEAGLERALDLGMPELYRETVHIPGVQYE